MTPCMMELLAQSQLHGFPITTWSPLGGGSLFTGNDEKSIRLRECLKEMASPKASTLRKQPYHGSDSIQPKYSQ